MTRATVCTGTWSPRERIDANDSAHGAHDPAVALDANTLMVLWRNALSVPTGANDDDILSRWRAP